MRRPWEVRALSVAILVVVRLFQWRTSLAALAAMDVFESHGPGGGGAFFSSGFSQHNANEVYVTSDLIGRVPDGRPGRLVEDPRRPTAPGRLADRRAVPPASANPLH